jgi:hypothetical protein
MGIKLSIEQLREKVKSVESPHNQDAQEAINWEINKHYADGLGIQNEIERQNMQQRKTYAAIFLSILCTWLVVMVFIVIYHMVKKVFLSDAVLITLITTTTANIIGIMLYVAAYLFPKNNS